MISVFSDKYRRYYYDFLKVTTLILIMGSSFDIWSTSSFATTRTVRVERVFSLFKHGRRTTYALSVFRPGTTDENSFNLGCRKFMKLNFILSYFLQVLHSKLLFHSCLIYKALQKALGWLHSKHLRLPQAFTWTMLPRVNNFVEMTLFEDSGVPIPNKVFPNSKKETHILLIFQKLQIIPRIGNKMVIFGYKMQKFHSPTMVTSGMKCSSITEQVMAFT